MKALGIDPEALEKSTARDDIYKGLTRATFFDKETFGSDRLVTGAPKDAAGWQAFLKQAPLSEAARAGILKIETGNTDPLPGLTQDAKRDKLSRLSYADYLTTILKADKGVLPYYQHRTDDLWGCGIDAISALDCWGVSLPGFDGLKLTKGGTTKRMGYTPAGYSESGGSYSFHYPDGNASIARLLVRALIPGSIEGHDAKDIVTAKADYAKLDVAGAPVRIRLNQVVVRARNVGKGVEIAYTQASGGKPVIRVRAKDCVLASWNMMIPYLVPELPPAQKAALHRLIKTPLVYTSVALNNWQAFRKLGIRSVSAPGGYHTSFSLNQPMAIGGYATPADPASPTLIRMIRTPAQPGLPEREQHNSSSRPRRIAGNPVPRRLRKGISRPAGPHPGLRRLRSGARYRGHRGQSLAAWLCPRIQCTPVTAAPTKTRPTLQAASNSAASPSPIRIPAWPPIPTSPSTRPIAR